MLNQFSAASRLAIQKAYTFAAEGSGCVSPTLLFLGILAVSDENSEVAALLTLSGVKEEEARLYALSVLEIIPAGMGAPPLTTGAKKILELAKREAWRASSSSVEIEHLFIACVRRQKGPHLGEVLRPLGLDERQLRRHLKNLERVTRIRAKNPLLSLAKPTRNAVDASHRLMRESYNGQISTAHLLLGLLADEGNDAVTTLAAAGVDREELRALARAQITTDGKIAGPHQQFTPASKRAIEWARDEARQGGHAFIQPRHLLFALLPHPEVISENWPLASSIDDPLQKVWLYMPVDEIRRQDSNPRQQQFSLQRMTKPSANSIQVNWRWASVGLLLWLLALGGPLRLALLCMSFGLAIFVTIRGEITQNYALRDRCGNICYGIGIGLMAVFLLRLYLPEF